MDGCHGRQEVFAIPSSCLLHFVPVFGEPFEDGLFGAITGLGIMLQQEPPHRQGMELNILTALDEMERVGWEVRLRVCA